MKNAARDGKQLEIVINQFAADRETMPLKYM